MMSYFDRLTRRSVRSLTGTSSRESFLKFSIQISETNLRRQININQDRSSGLSCTRNFFLYRLISFPTKYVLFLLTGSPSWLQWQTFEDLNFGRWCTRSSSPSMRPQLREWLVLLHCPHHCTAPVVFWCSHLKKIRQIYHAEYVFLKIF